MRREIDLAAVSDGKRYGLNDMVKAGCNDCRGCSACCHGMGSSIVLDPLDVFRLEQALSLNFQELLEQALELNVAEGVILPNLRMGGPEESCVFLNQQGRCRIHEARPGFCRMFPLGRIYENGGFQYFLQVHECPAKNKTKVKVRRWIDTPDLQRYESFILQWHDFLKRLQEKAAGKGNEETVKKMNLYVLSRFFMQPYDLNGDFYIQFAERLEQAEKAGL